jgi:DNA polymerase-3 subunit delta'
VREAVADRASESAQLGRGRCFIIPSAERLHGAAANALLKVLEEPPPGVRFLLTAASAALVLGTIRSRSRLVRLQPLDCSSVERVLVAGGIDPSLARLRAAAATGSHRGLWTDHAPPPLDALLSLATGGWSSAAIATVVEALPKGGGDEGAQSAAGEQRKALRQWLLGLCQRLRTDFRGDPAQARRAAEAIQRIQGLLGDLQRNLPARLVIEALASGSLSRT